MRSKKLQASSVALLLLCCVISEAAIADTDNYSMNQAKANYSGDYADFRDLKTSLDAYHGDTMYRMELTDLRTRMDPAWYDYFGLSTFSSMASEKLSNLQSHLGVYGNFINSYTYHVQTPVYNAMMGLQYVVKKKDADGLENDELFRKIVANDTYAAYRNLYCLPVAFCANQLVESWNDTDSNPFDVQADFMRRAAGTDGLYVPMAVTDIYCDNVTQIEELDVESGSFSMVKTTGGTYGSVTITIAAVQKQNCYLYVKSSAVDTVYANGNTLNATQSIDEAYILDLGRLEQDEEIRVEIPLKDDSDSGSVTFYACGVDMEAFREGFETLQAGQLEITSFKETRIEGTLRAEDSQILYTSIPYDEGWRVWVDGVRVPHGDYLRIGNALLGLRIGEGEHEIVMEFEPIGLHLGLFVSVGTLAILIFALLLHRRRSRRNALLPVTPQVQSIEEIPSPQDMLAQQEETREERFSFDLPDTDVQESQIQPDADAPEMQMQPDTAFEAEETVNIRDEAAQTAAAAEQAEGSEADESASKE